MVPTKAATISSTTWKSVFRDTMTCWAPLMHVNFDPDDCGFSPFSPSILIAANRLCDAARRRTTANLANFWLAAIPHRLACDFSPTVVTRDLSAPHAARKAP